MNSKINLHYWQEGFIAQEASGTISSNHFSSSIEAIVFQLALSVSLFLATQLNANEFREAKRGFVPGLLW